MSLLYTLPGPYLSQWEWQLQGACRGTESEIFYHPDGERGRARVERDRRAKEICDRCPVIAECAAHALRSGETYGVWGGMTEAERQEILRVGVRAAG